MNSIPDVMTETMLQAAHEAAYASRGLDWRAAEQARWAAIIAVMPKQDDATRLVWAMNNMSDDNIVRRYCAHVMNRGGTGDLSDCRSFVDEQTRQ